MENLAIDFITCTNSEKYYYIMRCTYNGVFTFDIFNFETIKSFYNLVISRINFEERSLIHKYKNFKLFINGMTLLEFNNKTLCIRNPDCTFKLDYSPEDFDSYLKYFDGQIMNFMNKFFIKDLLYIDPVNLEVVNLINKITEVPVKLQLLSNLAEGIVNSSVSINEIPRIISYLDKIEDFPGSKIIKLYTRKLIK